MNRNHIDVYLETLAKEGGSDLHLSPALAPRIRIDGTLQVMKTDPLPCEQIHMVLEQIMDTPTREGWARNKNADFAYDAGVIGRFRVNALMQRHGAAAVFRIIPATTPTCDQLNIPPAIRRMAHFSAGLVLITGPTGSGKSTTMAALVNEINETRGGHIITIEDPIEFVHESKNCIVTQRELGPHVDTFAQALKYSLRQDPDVIVVGEMRDPETIQTAITLAETGHLIFGTLHTYSAMKAVDRIVDSIATDRQQQVRTQLAEVLKGVVAQKLVPTAQGKGRIAAHEIMLNNKPIANMLKTGKTAQIQNAMNDAETGMQTMEQALAQLVIQKWVTPKDALANANDQDQYKEALQTLQAGA